MAEMNINISGIVLGALEQCRKDGYAVMRWIPCSERLPENDAKCLVYTSDERVCMARWYGKYDEQGAWYIISDEVPKLYRIKNVPFWMHLPEPPESEVQEDDKR